MSTGIMFLQRFLKVIYTLMVRYIHGHYWLKVSFRALCRV